MSVTTDQLFQLYLAYFGRPPDADGMRFYTSGNHELKDVAAAFSASPESVALHGSSFGTAQVNAIYQSLFNRDAEPAGQAYWQQEVNSGRLSPAQAAMAILTGAQNADKAAVSNKLALAHSFYEQLDTPAEINGYAGTAAAALARNFIHSVDASDASLASAQASLQAKVLAITGTGQVPPVGPPAAPDPVFAVSKDGGDIVSFTTAGAQISVTEALGVFTFTSSGTTGTAAAPITGIVVPTGTTLSISSVLASGKTFSGAGTALVVANTTGEDLSTFTATGVTGFQLTSGESYTLTAAQAAIGRIGAAGAAGTLTDGGTIIVRDSLAALGGGVAATLKTKGADSVIATAATSADVSAISVAGIDSITLATGQNYTMTAAQAALVATAPGAQTLTLTTPASGTLSAAVESFVLGNFANTATLGAAAQNVSGAAGTASSLAIGGLAATGTWTLANGADTLVATNGANIAGVNAGAATTAENLTLTGAITMTRVQHEAFTGTVLATGGADAITISGAGAVTAKAGIESYALSGGGANDITVLAGTTGLTGAAGNATTVTVGGGTVAGTWALGNGADSIVATDGADISGVNAGSATSAENLTLTGGVSMTLAQHDGLAITAAGGSDKISITTGGAVTAKAGIESYAVSSGGTNSIMVLAGATGLSGAAGNATTVTVGGNTVSGTWALANGADSLVATDGASIAGVNLGAATTAENLTLTGGIAMTLSQHDALAITAAGGVDKISITSGGAVTAKAGIESYAVSGGGANNITVLAGATGISGAAGNATTVTVGGGTVSGTWALANGTDSLVATDGSDISGVNTGSAISAENLTLTGGIAMTLAQHDGLAITAAGGADKITISSGGTVTAKAGIESYVVSGGGANNITVLAGVTGLTGAVGNATTVTVGGNTVSGTWALGNGADVLVATSGANIAGVNTGAATTAENLTLTGAITMTRVQHEALAVAAAGGADAVTITTAGAVTAKTGIESYALSGGGANAITLLAGATDLSGAAGNVTTVAVGSSTVSGTWALGNGADAIVATNGANIAGVNAGAATTAESLTLAGGIAMTQAQYLGLTSITAAGGSDAVAITSGGAVTARAGIEAYALSGGGANNITVLAGAIGLTGAAGNATTVTVGGNTVSGTWALANAADSLVATDGADISGVNTGSATSAENLTLSGGIAMTQAQYLALTSITAAGGADAVNISTAGAVAAKAGIESYALSSGGTNSITVLAGATGLSGAAGNATTVTVGGNTVSGTWALANGADVLVATDGASIAGVNAGAATTAESLTLTGGISMTLAQHDGLAITAAGGADAITISTAGTVTAKAGIESYVLSGGGANDITVLAGTTGITGAAGNATTVTVGGGTVAGTWALANGADALVATSGANITAVNTGAATSAENLTLTGGITMTRDQHEAFTGTVSAGGGSDSVTITTSGVVTLKAGVESYIVAQQAGTPNTMSVSAAVAGVNITGGKGDALVVVDTNVTATGNWSLNGTSDGLSAATGANISGVNGGLATTAKSLNLIGAMTMTQAQHQGFTSFTAVGASDSITITTGGAITAGAGINSYVLSGGGANNLAVLSGTTGITGSMKNATTVTVAGQTVAGTWALAHTTDDTIVATGTSNIAGVNGGAVTSAEKLTLTGAITMTRDQHEALAITGAGGSDAVTITTQGIVTLKAGVESYIVSQPGKANTVSMTTADGGVNIADDKGTTTVEIDAGTVVTGTWSLSGNFDAIGAANGVNLSGINGGADTTARYLTVNGSTISMSQAQHEKFTSIVANGSSDVLTITSGGAVKAWTGIETYALSGGGANNITVLTGATGITGSANYATTVTVGAGLAVSGTWTLNNGFDVITAASGSSIAGVNGGAGTTGAETLNITGTVSMTAAQHGAMAIAVGSSTDAAKITTGGTVNAKASVGTYSLSSVASNTLNVNGGKLDVGIIGDASNATTVSIGGNTVTGTYILSNAADVLDATDGANIAGATLTQVERLAMAGAVTMRANQYGAFSQITAGGSNDRIILTQALGASLLNAAVEHFTLAAGNNSATLEAAQTVDATALTAGQALSLAGSFAATVTLTAGALSAGSASGNLTVNAGTAANTIIGGSGNDTVNAGGGDDLITGGNGTDTLNGDNGNDTFFYDSMALFLSANALLDLVNGGSDIDTAEIEGSIILATASDLTRMTSVERITARSLSTALQTHSVIVNSDFNLGGVTTIDLSGDTNSGSAATIDFTGVTTAMTLKGVGAGKNTITGGSGADTLIGSTGVGTVNTINGGMGADTIVGGSGHDFFIYDSAAAAVADDVTGGGGTDSVLFRSTTGETLVVGNNFKAGLSYMVTTNSTATANGTTAENINASTHTGGAVTLTGNAGNNILTGSVGADTLVGGGGNDTMRGGAGGDTITRSPTGTTTYVFENTASNNGNDSLNGVRADNTYNDVFNFSAFLGTSVVKRAAVDAIEPLVGLDLTTGQNVGIRYGTGSLGTGNIRLATDNAVAGEVAIADDGKAVVFSFSSGNSSGSATGTIYYVQDTLIGGGQQWEVFAVGSINSNSGSTSVTNFAIYSNYI
ncbi:DUF4214 domain-containing protein [uncultured Ramlibacter sp.]|uniref:DUF4214 domain-containing protein n=1 Tax=uncultured Ramlibacter sp. TaxID=260755 RepID=UPI00260FC0B5|nr:DUF4214 domain-containing protein [uncultured Ramlibacter sp.]